jgi:restriction endonuclease Mrr
VVDLLSKMGYGGSGLLIKAVGKPGDGGIDGIIHQE